MIFNEPSMFSYSEWMTVPFIIQPRNAHQDLADILLVIPGCIGLTGMTGSMSRFFSTPIPSRVDLQPVKERTAQLLQDLAEWASANPQLTSVFAGSKTARETSGAVLTNYELTTPTVVLADTFVALTAATYEAVRLILTLLQHKISARAAEAPPLHTHPTTPPYSPLSSLIASATNYARSILETVTFLESTHPVGFDFMRSVFPLVVVAILGPEAEEQNSALKTLERWGESRGVGGLCGAWIKA